MTFVESNEKVAETLREAAADLGVERRCEFFVMRAERAVARLERQYDVVFADPPFALGFPAVALGALRTRNLLAPNAVVVYEHDGHLSPETPGFVTTREERYGDVVIAFLRAEE